jgi:hypothetical protein
MPQAGRRRSRPSPSTSWWRPAKWPARRCCPRTATTRLQGELAAGELQLPWPAQDDVAGVRRPPSAGSRAARRRRPGRLVASAKSWLSHPGVDRTAPILPWGAEPTSRRSRRWRPAPATWRTCARPGIRAFPARPLEQQQIVLTVPASFDEGARALTLEAARLAGLPSLRLLEEPQAALYDWLHRHRDTLAEELADARLVLVADVGGGTTDFSLVKVELEDGVPKS